MSTQTEGFADSVLAPLDHEEAAVAVREALETVTRDGTVAQDRTTVYAPVLRIEKPPRLGASPARLVWVRIRDRDRRVVHEVFVEAGSVTEHVISKTASPPFSEAEHDEARRLLAEAAELARLLSRGDVGIEWFNPGHGPERLIGARFVRVSDHQVVEPIRTAVVNLDEARLADDGQLG
jgi:hypothetical protein